MAGYGEGLYGEGFYGGDTGLTFLPHALTDARLAVEIAWGADLMADSATWTWTDISADVRQDPGITTSLGRGDEASVSQPAECTLVLDNTTGRYSLGPQSPNYPNVRRNTPVRVRVDPGDGTFRTVFFGGAAGFSPVWTLTGTDARVTLEAAGTLRRLLQGATPVISPIRRALLARTDVVAYWPAEDDQAATVLASALPNGVPMSITGTADLAADDSFLCSRPLPVLKGSAWSGPVTSYTATGAVQVRALVEFPTSAQATPAVLLRVHTTGTAARWDLIYEVSGLTGNGLISGTVYDRFGAVLADTVGVAFNVNISPLARRWSLEMVEVGGDIDWRFSTIGADATSAGYFTGPLVAGRSLGAATSVIVNPDGVLDEVTVGHISVQTAQTSIFDDRDELKAFDGEITFVRYNRLCLENGIPSQVFGDGLAFNAPTDLMGPQDITTALDLLRQVETADQGVLYDGTAAGLRFNTRRNSENIAAALTISAATAQLASPFGPVDDDQRTRNRVQVKRAKGAATTLEDTSGPLGVNTVGLYDDSVEINTQLDSTPVLYAGWLLAKGTVTGYRYPTLTVDLLATPELAVAWLALQPGRRIDVIGLDQVLPGHPAGTLSLLVEGLANDMTATTWTGTARCSPYSPWRIGTLAADIGSTGEYLLRLDTDGSTTSAEVAAGVTTLPVFTGAGPVWTTTADDYPLDLDVDGIQVRANACSGTGGSQTFTVDPLPVARPSGSPVSVWQPPALGL